MTISKETIKDLLAKLDFNLSNLIRDEHRNTAKLIDYLSTELRDIKDMVDKANNKLEWLEEKFIQFLNIEYVNVGGENE